MSYPDFSKQTKSLIAKGALKEAIDLLTIESGETYIADLEDEALLLSARFNKLEQDRIKNLLSFDEDTREQSKIANALLSLLDKLDQFHHNNTLEGTNMATNKLRALVRGLRSKSSILAEDQYFVNDLTMIFEEITKTYKVILDAITKFITPAFDKNNFDLNPYASFERGDFYDDVQKGRGHCHTIFNHYSSGLRDFLIQKIGADSDDFRELDEIFMSLANADYTVFDQMAQIGVFIEQASKDVLDLVAENKDSEARIRVLQGRKQLRDVEEDLKRGISEVRELQLKLGY